MRTETKVGLCIVFAGMLVFAVGSFLPKVEHSFFSYDVFNALAWMIVSFGSLELAYEWIPGRILGFVFVSGAFLWLSREMTQTASQFSKLNIVFGAILATLLIIQFCNHKK